MAKFEHIINENNGIERSNTIFEKSKKPVKVTRDGKTFIQMREEGKQDEVFVNKIKQKLRNEGWNGTDRHAHEILNETVNPVGNKKLYDKYIAKKGVTDRKSAGELYNEAKEQVFEYLENHDVRAGDVTADMIADANEIMELGLSSSEIGRLAVQYRNKKIREVLDNKYDEEHEKKLASEEKLSDEDNPQFLFSTTNNKLLLDIANGKIDPKELAIKQLKNRKIMVPQSKGLEEKEATRPHKEKAESLQIGVKNLKSNLKSQIDYYENVLKSNSRQSEFPDKITEGKLMGLKRAMELLDDGLKHLL